MSLPPPPPPPPPGYVVAGYGVGFPAPPRTDGLAVASLVCGLAGFVACGIPSVVGLVLGLVSLRRIGRSGGRLAGRGMAITGVVLGIVWLALIALFALVVVVTPDDPGLR